MADVDGQRGVDQHVLDSLGQRVGASEGLQLLDQLNPRRIRLGAVILPGFHHDNGALAGGRSDPNQGGTISIEYSIGEATVIFDSVPEFFNTGANTFMATMRVDGSYTIEYGAVSATDGLAGTTEGGGAADPGETDLSAGGPYPKAGTTYEHFIAADNDLAGDTLEFDQ